MEKRIIFFWNAGFFLPAINATVFSKMVPESDVSLEISLNHAIKAT